MNSTNVVNGNFVESDVIIKIYGACVNPLLKIEDNVYQVDVELDSFEYLEINTSKRTITKFSKYGDTSNLFDKRNKTYDVFKRIPLGRLTISANGRVYLTRYVMSKEGVQALKTQQATISKEDASAILEAMASLDLETKEVEENGWQLRMYKNVGGKNRLVKTIVHDEKNPKGFNEWIRSLLPFEHLFVFGGSYYSWEK